MVLQWYYIKNADSPVPGPTRGPVTPSGGPSLPSTSRSVWSPTTARPPGFGPSLCSWDTWETRLGWESDNQSWVRHETHGESIIAPCFVSVNKIPSSTGSKMRQWLELHGHSMMNSKSPSLKPNPWPHGNVVWMRSVLSGRWCLKVKGIPLEELARYAKILVYLSPL